MHGPTTTIDVAANYNRPTGYGLSVILFNTQLYMDIESRRAQMLSVGEERASARCWSGRGFSSRCLRTVFLLPFPPLTPVTDNGCFGWFWTLENAVLRRLRARPDTGRRPFAFMNRNYRVYRVTRVYPSCSFYVNRTFSSM